jgi:hypothetical protein
MNSNDFILNLKYYGKFIAIIVIIFLLLKFVMNIKFYEALLLSLIITVSILIIENIIYINDIASDPLNCDQCKVNIVEINEDTNNLNLDALNDLNNIVPNPNSDTLIESEQSLEKTQDKLEPFTTNPLNKIIDNLSDYIKKTINNSSGTNREGFGNTDELEKFINEQQNQNKNLANKLKSDPNIQANIGKVKNTIIQQSQPNQNNQVNQADETQQNPYLAKTGLLNKPELLNKPAETKNNLDSPITYDEGYVVYQNDGLQKKENDISLNNALFKMGIGEQNVVKPFIRDGADYYRKIQSYSSQSPTPAQALNSELRYGDYNYIGPLNSGMTNSDYTFVSPNNWYPVPPHPPVCVTNKQCTTCPIQISDGKDYMNWATLEDFDKARRFTGNMNINIDYVKNVLNNDEGY